MRYMKFIEHLSIDYKIYSSHESMWVIRWLDGITDSTDKKNGKLWEMVMDRKAWHAAVHRVTKVVTTEQLNWTDLLNTTPCSQYYQYQNSAKGKIDA